MGAFLRSRLAQPGRSAKILWQFPALSLEIQPQNVLQLLPADASTWLALRCEPKKSLHNLRA